MDGSEGVSDEDSDDFSDSDSREEEQSGSEEEVGVRLTESEAVGMPGGMEAFLGLKKRKLEDATTRNNKKYMKSSADADRSRDTERPHGSAEEDEAAKTPPSFSNVVTSLSPDTLREKFPDFLDAKTRELDVTLVAGEMLYLPCGWFHEVTSMSSNGGGGAGVKADGDKTNESNASRSSNSSSSSQSIDFHMAVNYWFHPPDSDRFDAPYTDSFWPENWRQRGLE